MPIKYSVLQKADLKFPKIFAEAEQLAIRFRDFLNQPEIQKQIVAVHKLGASSSKVQEVVLPGALALGFTSEKKGLFNAYRVPGLRPDYYLQLQDSGILLEVERGKTTTNNMDLLDLWKCHICEHADFLFLLVPQERPSANGQVLRHFIQAEKRLETFFQPKNYVNVEATFLFGY